MTDRYVLDSEAVLAFVYQERGYDHVSTVLSSVRSGAVAGYLASANASEVCYLLARDDAPVDGTPTSASLRSADRDVRALERIGVAIEPADWRTVAEVKAPGSLSLADAAAVALAADRDATLLVGGDDDFDSLPVEVAVERIRTGAA